MKEYDYVILGGNLCSLVVANELASAGKRIALVAPEKSIGGHFSEYSAFGFDFDLGMVLLEFDSYMEQTSDLSLYNDVTLGRVGAFSDVVEAYLKKHVEYKRVDDIVVSNNGRITADYFISNDLSGLNDLFTSEQQTLIKAQLTDCMLVNEYHPSNKACGSNYNCVSFSASSESNHGAFLHQALFEPLVNKVTNLSSKYLLGKYHRLFWAPIYYPETLLKQFKEGDSGLSPTAFSYPVKGNIATITKALYQQVCDCDGVEIYQDTSSLENKSGNWLVNNEMTAPKLISSLPQNILASLLDIKQRPLVKTSYVLIFMKVEDVCDFNVLFNADNSFLFFRIVNNGRLKGERGSSYLVVEYNYDYVVAQSPDYFEKRAYIKEIERFLSEYSIVESPRITNVDAVYLMNKLAFPTPGNLSSNKYNLSQLSKVRGLSLMGPSLGIGVSSMNNQIVQALKYASSEGLI
ncbi:NAD(P)-binding protein [Alkalimarinus alittae]|uniref:FAD dependent oxidoreductase n=1 Tax=Alkalimarinus alittae TaxID=2961619 RepID=A0ABY6N697_9ALTE|nr:NAD(P)-binding protein [Alkalimarinus alittae]UZE97555.1 hypothetical protein NKI27_07380 [Alkalimarinus alittae]